MAGGDRHSADDALALDLAAGATRDDAARKAGVSPRTVFRRLADPAFRRKVEAARAELLERTVARLASLGPDSADTLQGLLQSADEKTRLGAVRTALEFMLRGHELHTLVRQVEELRRQLEETPTDGTGDVGTGGGAAQDGPAPPPGDGRAGSGPPAE